MNLQTIEEGVYLFRGETYDSNATIFVYGGQAVMVDALASRADAAALKHWLEENLGARVRYIVATHYFSDHLAALGLFPESDIIAHRHYRHTFDSELYRSDEERGFFVEPTLLVGDGLELRWGRFHLEIFHNPGHTMSTLCVDVPEAGLLHVGDTLVGRIAYFLYTSPGLVAAALERLRRRAPPRVLASHGGISSPLALDTALAYLGRLGARVRAARSQPDAPAAIGAIPLAECLPEGEAPSEFEALFHARNLKSVVERQLFAES